MHCELVVPGLIAAAPAARLPAAELLLARGRCRRARAQRLEAWLAAAFGLDDAQPLAAGALTVLAAGRDPGAAAWARADPVHLRLMRDRLILAPPQALSIAAEEARELCEALSRHFAPAVFEPLAPARWCMRLAQALPASAESPLDLAGREVGLALPEGLTGLLNEAQMLLHAHPVNEAREARGEPALNSLWLWGAGRTPAAASAPWRSVSAEEPLALGLARAAGIPAQALGAGAEDWLARAPADGRHLVVLEHLRAPLALGEAAGCAAALERLEREWFAPLLAALRAGRIGMVSVHVPDAAQGESFETVRGDLRRFWRRRRALARYA